MEPKPTTTFHLFPLLPFELRARIWELTVEPRTVEVGVVYEDAITTTPDTVSKPGGHQPTYVPHVVSSTPVPATLQTCREARNLRPGLYQRCFSEISPAAATAERDRYYVWLNPETDTVFVRASTRLETLRPVAPLVRRLKITRECTDAVFYYFESEALAAFVNVREICVVCEDGLGAWRRTFQDRFWPCENVVFVDPDDENRVMRLRLGRRGRA
jgi:hypothetical protein